MLPFISNEQCLSSKKPAELSSRTRKRTLSIKEVRQAAESVRESKQPARDRTTEGSKSKAFIDKSKKLPEKFEILSQFFNSLDSAARLLRFRGLASNFSNLCPKIQVLTNRKFTYGHLAQLKFILPEAIELKKVLVFDELTTCLKPDLHISFNFGMLDNQDDLETGNKYMQLRKLFRTRLSEFLSSHLKIDDVPKSLLPKPFNCPTQDLHHSEDQKDNQGFRIIKSMVPMTVTGPTKLKEFIGTSKLSSPVKIPSTPAKLVLTRARLMATTLTMTLMKRSSLSSNDHDDSLSTNKLLRRPPCSRSLLFDDDDILDVLPLNLQQSRREKEMKAKEEQMPSISQAKRRQKMIANLPKFFNAIFFLFHKRTVIRKEELIYKIIVGNMDIVDRREIEEQLDLLVELVPEWISEKLASTGDVLMCIDKLSSSETVRARLEEVSREEKFQLKSCLYTPVTMVHIFPHHLSS